MSANVTVKESIWIAAPIETVWDYTQDYAQRHDWDDSILEAEVVQEEPARLIHIRA
ncbi:MAG: SRPBCC family protein, partial [Anaerolineae bacterium]